MVLAAAVLIAALAGTAVAVDKITSGDIAKNAVRSKHIKAGQVKANDTDVTKSRFAQGLKTGNSVLLPELDLAVRVKRGDVVSVHGFALARDAQGAGGDACRILLDVDAPGFTGQDTVLRFDSSLFIRRSFDGSGSGGDFFSEGSAIDYLVPGNGRFGVRAAMAGSALTACEIRDRGLAVTVNR
jgi:hypothetical protein